MGVTKKEQPVDALEVGMYVSELDRPWLETPFLFQGFLIEDDETIEQLRQFCKYVYIDVNKQDESLDQPEPAMYLNSDVVVVATDDARSSVSARQPAAPRARVSTDPGTAVFRRSPERQCSADSTVALRAELVNARSVHSTAERAVVALFDKLRDHEQLDAADVRATLDPMIDSIMRNDDALSWLARMKRKDNYMHAHSLSCSVWAMLFGKHLGLDRSEVQVLATGAMFLDVGKTRIDAALLTKPDELAADETAAMRRHVEYGIEIAAGIGGLDSRVAQMIEFHHERYNGAGYPHGLSGSQIPVFARIAGIVDTYDAMTTARPYAAPMSSYDAVRQLNKLAGVEFAEEMVEQFVQAIGMFPVGSLVELNTGEVGVVVAQNRVRRLRPRVMLILDRDKQPQCTHETLDLRRQLTVPGTQEALYIDRGLSAGDYGIDPADYYL